MGIMDSTGGMYAVFAAPGDSVTGTITGGVEEYEAVYKGQPKLTRSGRPVVGYRVRLATDEGTLILEIEKWRMRDAVQRAVLASGAADIEHGGTLTVTREQDVQGDGPQPAQTFTAVYVPPSAGAGTPAPALAPGSHAGSPDSSEPQRPAHVPEAVWAALSGPQRAAVVAAPPF
jgi:hypothetical protein